MSRHVSCLMTVSLSGVANCLFCDETLTFLGESRLLGLLRHFYLPTVKWLFLRLLFYTQGDSDVISSYHIYASYFSAML